VPDLPAIVRDARPGVDRRLTVSAAVTAASELGVELLEHLRGDLPYRHVAERGFDRAADVATVAIERRLLGLVRTQPRLQGLPERDTGTDVALLVDLAHETTADPLRFASVGVESVR
jgi:hypothetical protein